MRQCIHHPLMIVVITSCLVACSNYGSPDVVNTSPSGSLIAIRDSADAPQQIITFDVANQETTSIFTAESFSQLHQLDVSTDGRFLIFAYTPPPADGSGFLDRSALFYLDLTQPNAAAQHLIGGDQPQNYYLEPAIAPDNQSVYYTKVTTDFTAVNLQTVAIEQLDLTTNKTTTLIANGLWPQPSPNGSQLAFVGVDPYTQQRALLLAESDGSNIEFLIQFGNFFDLDLPIFSEDGDWLYFTVVEEPELSWFDRLTGVQIAHAHIDHNLPANWWRIPTSGGIPEKLTDLENIILYGDFHPSGRYMVYSTSTGLQFITEGGTSIQTAPQINSLSSLSWLP